MQPSDEFETQLPAVTPNYETFIGAGKDGLVICDPLHFLPTRVPRRRQLLVLRATPSAAAAIDLQQPNAGTRAHLDLAN